MKKLKELFLKRQNFDKDNLKKESLKKDNLKKEILAKDNLKIDNKDSSDDIKSSVPTAIKDVIIVQPKEGEYDIVEIEILPEKMICPDCGGITLVGLDFCDKCGGELSSYES